jgi:putative drug exporter of the RND superfamily
MHRSFSHRWASAVTKHWAVILVVWIVVAVGLRVSAPNWNDVAYDGDFDYLPADMSSVAGGQLLDKAFPGERARSEIVLVLGRSDQRFTKSDQIVGLDLLRRLYHRLGEVSWKRAIAAGYPGGPVVDGAAWAPWIQLAQDAFTDSIDTDEKFYERIAASVPDLAATPTEPRMAIAYWDRGKLLESIEASEEAVGKDFEAALILMPDLPKVAVPIDQRELAPWQPLLDILSWNDRVIGSRLTRDNVRLAVLQLSSELAATGNIATIEAVKELIDDVLRYSGPRTEPGIELLMTGSAAIGGETLMAARDAIRYTELITVLLILVILAAVYRAPLLVAIPMVSIGVAVLVSTSLVSLLTSWSIDQTVPGLDIRIFTTSRIFIVVILFGAGTDYCLFLIARLREEASKAPWPVACRASLSGVLGALFGSAMTTIVGLGMLWIARFGKFHYTGPIIAICLLVGLLVCTTLTPALLRAIGPVAFWPSKVASGMPRNLSLFGDAKRDSASSGMWGVIALWLTRRPITTLAIGLVLLAIPATYGFRGEDTVTYDFSSQLSSSADSRRGLRLLSEQFDIGEINPVTVLIEYPQDVERKEVEKRIRSLAKQLYGLDGVLAVRTVDDPLGDFPPDREMGLLTSDAWKRRALRNHRVAKRYFFSSLPEFENRLARLDVVVDGDPFAIETADRVSVIKTHLEQLTTADDSDIAGARVLLAGTTPSIIDLRSVTLQDNRRIKVAVVIAVFAVLWLVIRRFGLCLYLIATVLISYYATLGLTLMFFRYMYGDDFVGLDWKLPLFLFVILVAVGQDYNVYLVTRIVEEQRRLGWLAALRRAISRTGGIITACGLVMAATFFSMTASAWLPVLAGAIGFDQGNVVSLRGIVELGFALGLGVLIDTFYVRTILVPSFVAAMGKQSA